MVPKRVDFKYIGTKLGLGDIVRDIHVRSINEKTWNEFKKIVTEKHGKQHTVLGQEVEQALREYINNRTSRKTKHTHTQDEHARKHNPTIKKIDACKQVLKDTDIWGSVMYGSCHSNAVRKAIQPVVGYDTRTIDKYLSLLCDEFSWGILEDGYVAPLPSFPVMR